MTKNIFHFSLDIFSISAIIIHVRNTTIHHPLQERKINMKTIITNSIIDFQLRAGKPIFSEKAKEVAWEHLINDRTTVTARHENRAKLERLAEITAEMEELQLERDALLLECEMVIKAVGTEFEKGKWAAFIQKGGVAYPYVLSITAEHERADFAGYCRANGVTAEAVKAAGFATKVSESRRVTPAGKTHKDKLIRQHCLELIGVLESK